VALPSTLFLSRLRVAPATPTAPLAIDNLRYTTASLPPAADVPVPLPAVVIATLLVLGIGHRRAIRARSDVS
jgi:hypothetical protein